MSSIFIYLHFHLRSSNSLLVPSYPRSPLFIPDATTDRALCFLESSVVGGTTSLLVDAGAESGVRDGEGRGVMGDILIEVGVLVFEVPFLFVSRFPCFWITSISFGYLIPFYCLCVRRFSSFCFVGHSFVRFRGRSSSSGWFGRIRQFTVVRFRFTFISFWSFFILWFSIVRLRFLSSGLMPVQFFVSTSFCSVFLSSPLPLPPSLFFSPLSPPLLFACIRDVMF